MKQLYKIFIILALLCNFSNVYALNITAKNTAVGLFVTAPTIKGNNICGSGTTTLSIEAPVAGVTYTWYDAATAGSLLTTGTSYTTPTLNTSTTYYVEASDDVSTRTSYTVYVNPFPVSSFTAPTTIDCASQAYSFINKSTGNNLTYLWDFGNPDSGVNNASTDQNPNHIYVTTPGNGEQIFTVTLTVTSSEGCTSTANNTVKVKQSPDTALNSTADGGIFNNEKIFKICSNSPEMITFYNASTSTNVNYKINWGDGTPEFSNSTWTQLNHTYSVGYWTLAYTITGQNGCVITDIYKIFVGSNPQVSFGTMGNTDICIADELTFPITGISNNPYGTIYTVTFNDGSAPLVFNHPPPPTVSHTFLKTSCGTTSSNGTTSFQNSFSANIVASNPCNQSAIGVVPIYVSTPPIANFKLPNTSSCINNQVCITNSTTNASQVGNSGTSCNTTPKVIWSISPSTGVSLASGTYGNDFGSTNYNAWTTGSNVICPIFSQPGTYTITLTTANRCGSSTKVQTVCIEKAITPSFTLNNSVGCGSLTAQANNTTPTTNTCNITYNWAVTYTTGNCGTTPGATYNYFATGSSATSVNPSFNFPNAGTYSVKLTATNSCGSQTATQTVTVKAPPTATIATIPSVCGGTSAVINPTATVNSCGSQGTIAYLWSFPGGIPSTSIKAIPDAVTYSAPGPYTVTLAVTTECGTVTTTKDFTVSPTPVIDAVANQEKCAGQSSDAIMFNSNISGVTYAWLNSNTNIGLAGSGTGNINSFILKNTGTTPITSTITVTPKTTDCTGTSKTFTITVQPTPVVNAISPITVCNGTTVNAAAFASTISGTVYNWVNNTPSIGLAASGTGNLPSFTGTNTTNTAVTAQITVTPANALGCNGTPVRFNIIVNPNPVALVLSDQNFCNAVTTNVIVFANAVAGTNYTWTNSNTAIGLPVSGNGNLPSFKPVNTGSAPVTATITVAAVANGCSIPAQTFKITVNPSPVVTFSEPNQTICSGDTSTMVQLSSATTGVNFTWTATKPAGITTITTSGTDVIPAQLLTNTTNAPITITYNASGALSGGVACAGSAFSYTITVKPKPTVGAPLTDEICSGATFNKTPVNGSNSIIPIGTTYTWSNPVISPANSITGGIAQATPLSTIGQKLTNTIDLVATATYTVIPTANSCTGDAFTIVVTVNPTPTMNAVGNLTVCNGVATNAIVFSSNSTATAYSWSRTAGAIGIPINGIGDIPAFTATNSGSVPITSTVTVIPKLGSCTGVAQTFTITVNPAPAVKFSQSDQVICSETSTAAVTLSSVTPNTLISWIAVQPAGITGVATSGTTTIPAQNLTNTTNSPIVVKYIATATTTGVSCEGAQFIYTVTVNPKPLVVQQTSTICSGSAFTITPLDGGGNTIPTGTQYRWTAPTGTGFTGGSAQNTLQNNISQTLTNNTNAVVTATYTITPVTNSCSGTPFTAVITINPKPFINAQTAVICSGDAFTINPVNAGTNIVPAGTTYTWSVPVVTGGITGGIGSASDTSISGILVNPTNSAATATYTVTPTSPTGNCSGTPFTVIVTVNPMPVVTAMTASTCSGVAFTAKPVNTTNGLVPANTTYTWVAPAPIAGITGFASGTDQTAVTGTLVNTTTAPIDVEYTVTPKSGNCTGATFIVKVTVSPMPTVAAITNQTVCNGSATTAITFVESVPATQFKWVNSNPAIGLPALGIGNIASFTATNTTTSPITATIIVTPVLNTCTGTPQTFTITVNPAPTVIFSIADQVICSLTTSAAVNLTSATPGTTSSWTASIPAGITGAQPSGTTNIPAQTLVNTTSSPLIVIYTATAATSGASTCPGAPSVYTITVNPVPFVSATQQTVTCSGLPLNFIPDNLNGNNMPAGVTFTWAAPTGSNFTGGSAQGTAQNSLNQTLVNIIDVPVTATYKVTPKFGSCTGIPFTVDVIINPTAVIPNSTLAVCSGNNFTFDPAKTATRLPGGTIYTWSAPTGNVTGGASGSAQSVITGTLVNASAAAQTATYTITPTSPTGNCAGVPFTLVVTVNPVFDVTSVVSNYNGFQISTAGAKDGSITLTPTGGSGTYTYAWTGANGFTASTKNITNLGPGIYTVIISDGLCTTITRTFTINEPLPLVFIEVLPSHVNVNCFGQATGVIEVTITQVSIAPFDYAILKQDGTVVQNVLDVTATNHTFSNLPAGTYNIRVTDANNTIKFLNGIVITQPATGLAISSAVLNDFNGFSISCNGANNGSIDLTVTGGYPAYTYAWTGPNGFTAVTQDIANLSPGVYTVVIQDTTNACPITQQYTITEPLPVSFTAVVANYNGYQVSCFGGNNGSITVTPVGGTLKYTYAWTGPNGFTASTQNINNLIVGTYQLTLTDSNGCSPAAQTFILTQPAALTITESHVNVLCFGATTGSITVDVQGGTSTTTGIYTYAWTGPNGFTSSAQNLTNIAAGTYNLIATDANGCTIPLSVTLTQQPEIIITATTTPITCYGANNASINLKISGGNAPYTAAWSNLATGTYQDNLAAGIYLITVTDASGCVKAINVVIPEAPVFKVEPVFKNVSCNGAKDGSITLNLTGGVAPVTLIWSDGSTAGTQRNNLGPGIYTATITDGTPCNIVRTFTIIEPKTLSLDANITHALVCDDTESGAIDLLVAGGTPPYQFTWSNGATTEDLTAITSGNYAVIVIDANGCTKSGQYTITRPDPIVLKVDQDVSFNCDTYNVRQVNVAQAAGGVPPFKYSWSSGTVSGANGQTMTTNTNGTVIVTATDSKGCDATQTIEIDTKQLGNALFVASSYSFATYGWYSISDAITFLNISTGDYIQVAWNFGDGSVSTDDNPAHTYVREGSYEVTLTVTYPYGCVDTYKQTIVVTKGYDVMIPNGFTPNADGINDNFSAVYKGLKSIQLDVYDTWGSLIYSEKGSVIKGWNGYVNGIQSENGNYYYKIKAETFYSQLVTFEGPLVLIK